MKRTPTPSHFTPSTPDYDTIGEFYGEIRETLVALANSSGSGAFLDTAHRQCVVSTCPASSRSAICPDALAALDDDRRAGEELDVGRAELSLRPLSRDARRVISSRALNRTSHRPILPPIIPSCVAIPLRWSAFG